MFIYWFDIPRRWLSKNKEQMMSYILQGKWEEKRLDDQANIDQFSIQDELKGIDIPPGAKVLDAGCGSGILCRFLEGKFPEIEVSGCDQSIQSLSYAQENTKNISSKYFQHDIVRDHLKDKYDYIFNRLVAHHLGEEQLKRTIQNFFQALNEGGKIHIVDVDGVFLNLGTTSPLLREKIEKVKQAFNGDLQVARYLPSLLFETGFKNIACKIEVMNFQGRSRVLEVEQWKERFVSGLSFYGEVFGNEFEAKKFFKEYTQEAAKEHVPLFCNKFIVTANKS